VGAAGEQSPAATRRIIWKHENQTIFKTNRWQGPAADLGYAFSNSERLFGKAITVYMILDPFFLFLTPFFLFFKQDISHH
jgi:hypothetical protein